MADRPPSPGEEGEGRGRRVVAVVSWAAMKAGIAKAATCSTLVSGKIADSSKPAYDLS
jgi:hypothetical protein